MAVIKCSNCGKEAFNHSADLCITCYKKLKWKPKKVICKRCGKERIHHTKGFCKSCANFAIYYDDIKKANYRKLHNINLELYRKVTKKCEICDFEKVVDLHHLDRNHKNNSEGNLIGLCPNHHRMIHMYEFQKELFDQLSKKGLKVSELKILGKEV
jgi:ribosomal protein L37E